MRGFRRYASRRQKPVRSAPPELKSSAEFERTVKKRATRGQKQDGIGAEKLLRLQAPHRIVRPARARHLFGGWEEIARRVRKAEHVALLLDFDGTLAELRPFPSQVRLPKQARHALSRLAGCPRVNVAIISGRTLKDLRSKAGVPGVQCLGLHGWEQDGSPRILSKTILRQIKRARIAEVRQLRGLPGVWVEDKKAGFAVHFRAASSAVTRRLRKAFQIALKPYLMDVRVIRGEKTWEVLPCAVSGKGAAAKRLLAGLPRFTLPICVGDDTTDEEAFKELGEGITVRVGRPNRTRARFWLRNPNEIYRFLQRLEEELR